jgi:hypothetical protein
VALELNTIEYSPVGGEKVVVRLEGRWHGRPVREAGRSVLVVEDEGRRHRFRAIPQPRPARFIDRSAWSASFAVPVWLRSRLDGKMSLSIGDASLPVLEPRLRSALEHQIAGLRVELANGLAQAEALLAEARALTASFG